jgi:hypothetical protein
MWSIYVVWYHYIILSQASDSWLGMRLQSKIEYDFIQACV